MSCNPPFLKENIKTTSVIVVTVFFLKKMNLVQIKEATYLLPIFIAAENTVVRLLELATSLIFKLFCVACLRGAIG